MALKDETVVAGKVPSPYVPTKDDVGCTIRVLVDATNKYGSTSALSKPTPVIKAKDVSPLDLFFEHIKNAFYYGKWKKDSPGDYGKLQTYAQGGARPDTLTSWFGRALCDVLDERRKQGLANLTLP